MPLRVWVLILLALPAFSFAGEANPLTSDQIDAFVKMVADGSKLNAAYDMLVPCKFVLPAVEAAEKNETDPLKKSRLARLLGVMRTRDIMARAHAALHRTAGMEYEIDAEISTGGQKIQTEGHGTFAADGKHFRMESTMRVAGQAQKLLVVGDGEKIFRETSVLGPDEKPVAQQANFTNISTLKSEDDLPQNEVLNEFSRIQREFDVYAAEDAKIDGQDVIFLKAVSNQQRDRPLEEIQHSGQLILRKSDFLPLRSYDLKKIGELQVIVFSNIKIGEKVDPKLFIYKAPDGIDVQKVGK